MRINKQLVKKEWIKIEPIDRSFEVFNIDRTKNGKVTRFVLLKLEINGYIKNINVTVIDLNITDMFLEYDWLVKHNSEVNWDKETIWFTRCSKQYKTQNQDILFTLRTQRLQPTENMNKE